MQIAKHRAMRHVPIILFLNKKDLFEKKIQEVDLATCFPEYKGASTRHDTTRHDTTRHTQHAQ
jgi:hypothetical protein